MSSGNISITGVGNQPKAAETAVPQPQPAIEVAKPAAAPATDPQKAAPIGTFSKSQIRDIAKNVGEAVSIINPGIRFRIDESSKEVITQIIDKQSNEVIRQIPPEEIINVSRRLRKFLGALLDLQG